MNDNKRKFILYGILGIVWLIIAIIRFSTSSIISHIAVGCIFLCISIIYLYLSLMFEKRNDNSNENSYKYNKMPIKRFL